MYRVRIAVALVAVFMAFAAAGANGPRPLPPPPEFPEYSDRDPYYTDEFDALRACAERVAPTYRYDYDRPEVSHGEQIAELMRQTCLKEIEALAKLVSPVEKPGGQQEMTGVLDDFVVEPFFRRNQGGTPEQGLAAAPTPGTSALGTGGRRTHFRAAHGFGPDERVVVSRTDAFDAPNYIFDFGQRFSYDGERDGWAYSYHGSYRSWYGFIAKDGVGATLRCSRAYRGVVSWGDHCDLKVDRLISIGSRGQGLYPLRLCNPGHFETGDVLLRPPSPASLKNDSARSASLSIDGATKIPLPDGAACQVLDAALLSKIVKAKRLQSSFIGRFDTRTFTADGNGDVVAMGLALLERLHALTFDARAASDMRANQETLYHRAAAFTVRDALQAHDAWHASVGCVVGVAAHSGRNGDATIKEGLNDPACANFLADLDWQAASLRSGVMIAGDGAARSVGGPAKIAEARALVHNAAEALLAQGWRPRPRAQFADGETPARVMGRPGFAGRTEAMRAGASSSDEPYAYAIDGRRAWGVIPSSHFNGFNGKLPPQSIVITCDAEQEPSCTIRIATDDRKGRLELRSAGAWHGAMTCLVYDKLPLAGWRLFSDKYAKDEAAAALDDNGCVTERREVIARAVSDQSVGPVLVEPGGEPFEKDELVSFQEVTFALALTRFLAERVKGLQ